MNNWDDVVRKEASAGAAGYLKNKIRKNNINY